MKKSLKTIIALVLVCVFSLFAMASGSDDSGSGNQGTDSADNTSIGDYSVEIKSSRLTKDYEGKDVIIITYGFTNVASDKASSFFVTFSANAYQNGVGLNEAYFLDDDTDYSTDNQIKEIKKGSSIDVEVAYELNDSETDVVIEVEENLSFNDKIISKTFTIK